MRLEIYRLTLTHYMVDGEGEETKKTMIDDPITTQVAVDNNAYLNYPRSVVVNEMIYRLMDFMRSEVAKEEEKRW